jgi:hypothetical protein
MKTKLIVAAIALTAASYSIAGPTCTTEAKAKWQPEKTFQDKLKAEGFNIEKFKVTSGSCYEIYGKDKAGKKVEIYFNPVDGKIVKEERR